MWWDPHTIERTVTRQFVCSQLLPEEIERLDRPLGFGDGLTDGTYWEWIDQKAKRIFLILVDLGVPDQIFGVIDDSWDDQDLPIALDQVERLSLTRSKDEKSEKRFYYRQFHYLLRPINRGDHVIYTDNEVVPLDVVDRKQALAPGQNNHVDKVALPNEPGMVLCRRRIPLSPNCGPGYLSREDFLFEVNSIRNIHNDHLVSYWASYVHRGYGYVLFTPTADYSVKSLLTATPNTLKNLDKSTRRQLVMNWIHCLVDTLCFIHNRGLSHGNIKPSTVLLSNDGRIFFADFTCFSVDILGGSADKNTFDKEAYDYAAPEQWFRPTSASSTHHMHRRSTITSMSPPQDPHNFNINRSWTDHALNSPAAMMHVPTPHLNAQAADIFSVACVILELLSFILKKQGRPFATHRAAKHKSPGRGGAVLDSSFHKNLGQVESWMSQLAKEASKKDDQVFRGFSPMLHIVEKMLALHPSERPAAHDVQKRMYQVLTEACGISEPHCVHQYGGWDFGIGSLKLGSPPLLSMSATTRSTTSGGSNNSEFGEDTFSMRSTKRNSATSMSIKRLSLERKRTNSVGAKSRSGESVSGATITGGSVTRVNSSRAGSVVSTSVSSSTQWTLPAPDSGSILADRWEEEEEEKEDQESILPSPAKELPERSSSKRRSLGFDLGSGFQAIQNIRVRDKVRNWQSPSAAAGPNNTYRGES